MMNNIHVVIKIRLISIALTLNLSLFPAKNFDCGISSQNPTPTNILHSPLIGCPLANQRVAREHFKIKREGRLLLQERVEQ